MYNDHFQLSVGPVWVWMRGHSQEAVNLASNLFV